MVAYKVEGVKELLTSLDGIIAETDAATLKAMRAAHVVAKRSVKSGMRGKPRWNHRGKSPKYGFTMNIDKPGPAHRPRSGGPGKFTGVLAKNVGYVKRPKKVGGSYQGGIGAGGKRSLTNVYRVHVEQKYPYMRPGVDKAKPAIRTAFGVAWAKATET